MRVILDENMPAELIPLLTGHECTTVRQQGWRSISNGQLLQLVRSRFDVFLTTDRGIPFQHNHRGELLAIGVLRLSNNTVPSVLGCADQIRAFLETLEPGQITEICCPRAD